MRHRASRRRVVFPSNGFRRLATRLRTTAKDGGGPSLLTRCQLDWRVRTARKLLVLHFDFGESRAA